MPWRGKSLPQEAYRPGGLAGIQWPCGRVHGAETEFLMRCHGVRRGSEVALHGSETAFSKHSCLKGTLKNVWEAAR